MTELKGPDCLFPEEVHALVRALKRIKKYNDEHQWHVNKYSLNHPLAHQIIQDETIRWIRLLDRNGVVTKRRL